MLLFTPLLAFSELLRHFYAGMGCAFSGETCLCRNGYVQAGVSLTGALFSQRDAYGILLRFLLGKQKKMTRRLKTSKVSKSDSS